MCVCVCACVRSCVRACACAHACMYVIVRTYVGACMEYICVGVEGVCLPVSAHDNFPPVYEKIRLTVRVDAGVFRWFRVISRTVFCLLPVRMR